MSRKRTNYSVEFKTKLVLQLLQNDKTVSELASEKNVTPQNIINWKKSFLDNATKAMEPASEVKKLEKTITSKDEQISRLERKVGQVVVERDWLSGKLKSLDYYNKKSMIESELTTLSMSKQCKFLGISHSAFYYNPRINEKKKELFQLIQNLHEKTWIYGGRKVHHILNQNGHNISLNTVFKYRKELKIRAIVAVKQISTTTAIKEHKKYSYKLRNLEITKPNQVWSTDITYIKMEKGMVYMAAVIDWYSKAILSYSISNTMDTELTMKVLNEALDKYGKPEILNTDQGSQYTSLVHTDRLKEKKIIISMDGKGRATDNIAIERFWRSLKCERIYLNEYCSIRELKTDMDNYINFYNFERIHQTLKYQNPMGVYQNELTNIAA